MHNLTIENHTIKKWYEKRSGDFQYHVCLASDGSEDSFVASALWAENAFLMHFLG
ncbi:MAG: hypothetical protein IPL46_19740 [Saprospiraceae bacterium]|nr:hypothetical protein [Saprospiraceae bacterium]